MDLILWRHADAEAGAPDSGRQLTGKGVKQAEKVAQWLKPRLPKPLRVMASPTQRTQQTALALARDFDKVTEIGPGASAKQVLAAAGWPDAKGAVVVVGHQPTLGEVAALLLAGREADWTLKKGAVWWFTHRLRGGEGQTLLRAAISPDLL
ncbi:MAG: histidine phosphatase family protein [Betaproteobacteria bacterium]|nr:histidine phosphatase family protein [Betaproteobacteria bacterium]